MKKRFLSSTVFLLFTLLLVPSAIAQDYTYPSLEPDPWRDAFNEGQTGVRTSVLTIGSDRNNFLSAWTLGKSDWPYIRAHYGFKTTIDTVECNDGTRTCRSADTDYDYSFFRYRGNRFVKTSTQRTTPNSSYCPGQEIYVSETWNRFDFSSVKTEIDRSDCEKYVRNSYITPNSFQSIDLIGESTEIIPTEDGLAEKTTTIKAMFSDKLYMGDHRLPVRVQIPTYVATHDREAAECSKFTVNNVRLEGGKYSCLLKLRVTSEKTVLKPQVDQDGLYSLQFGKPEIISGLQR